MAKLKHFYDGKWKQLAPSLEEFEAVGLGEGGTTAPAEGHVDDIFRGGMYFIPMQFPGNPFNPLPCQLLVLPGMKEGERHDNIKAKQILYSLVDDTILTRQYISGSWTEWKITAAHIVETGSNANGEYLRFSDGTQMCYGFKKLLVATTPETPLHRAMVVLSFPAAFAVNTSVTSFLSSAQSGKIVSCVSAALNAGMLGYVWTQQAVTEEFNFSFIAIGRWK